MGQTQERLLLFPAPAAYAWERTSLRSCFSAPSRLSSASPSYKAATGPDVLSSANFPALLANRIDAAPATAGVQELKEWMSLLFYLDGGLGGSITSEYASTADFTQFGSYGIAVTNRNASYPIASIGQFVGTVASLQSAP